MRKTLTLRLSEEDAALVEHLRKITKQKTASKALIQAAREYEANARTIQRLRLLLDHPISQTIERWEEKLWD